MKNLFTFIFITIVLGISSNAQQTEMVLPASHLFQLDNPAATGLGGKNRLYLGAYKQWQGVSGAPTTAFVGISNALANRSIGLGGLLVYDKAGLINHTRLSFFAAYHANFSSKQTLSIGPSAQLQLFQFSTPNVIERTPLHPDGLNTNTANLGVSLNYQYRINKNQSFFNLMVYYPQLSQTLGLNSQDNQSTETLGYTLGKYLIVQAYLRYEFTSGVVFNPSARFHSQPYNGTNYQVADAALGFSFKKDVIQFRIGGKTGLNNQISNAFYLGLGFRIGKNVDAYLISEPIGTLGISGGAYVQVEYGKEGVPEVGPRDWQNQDSIKTRLARQELQNSFIPTVLNPPGKNTYISFLFYDNVNSYIDLLSHQDFLVQVPLPKLF